MTTDDKIKRLRQARKLQKGCDMLHVVKSRHMVTLHDEESPVTIQIIKSGRPGMFITIFEDPYEYARADTISETEAINLCRQFDYNFPMADLPTRVSLVSKT